MHTHPGQLAFEELTVLTNSNNACAEMHRLIQPGDEHRVLELQGSERSFKSASMLGAGFACSHELPPALQ